MTLSLEMKKSTSEIGKKTEEDNASDTFKGQLKIFRNEESTSEEGTETRESNRSDTSEGQFRQHTLLPINVINKVNEELN